MDVAGAHSQVISAEAEGDFVRRVRPFGLIMLGDEARSGEERSLVGAAGWQLGDHFGAFNGAAQGGNVKLRCLNFGKLLADAIDAVRAKDRRKFGDRDLWLAAKQGDIHTDIISSVLSGVV